MILVAWHVMGAFLMYILIVLTRTFSTIWLVKTKLSLKRLYVIPSIDSAWMT